MISARNAPELTISRKMQPDVVVVVIIIFSYFPVGIPNICNIVHLSFFHVIIYFERRNGDKYNVNKHGIQDSPFDKRDMPSRAARSVARRSERAFRYPGSTYNMN